MQGRKSNHLPKNTTLTVTPGTKAELFWQSVNCDHFLQNYRDDLSKEGKGRFHNIRFSQVARMLSGNVLIAPVPKSRDPNKYYAVSHFGSHYYFTTFTLDFRTDCSDTLFCTVLTCHVTYESRYIDLYKKYLKLQQERFKGEADSAGQGSLA